VVALPPGRCDLRDVPAVAERISQQVAGGASSVVVDLTAVDGADATLLGLLHRTHRRLADQDGGLAVVATGAIAHALEQDGLDDVLAVHATLQAALAPSDASLDAPDADQPATLSCTTLPALLVIALTGEWDLANEHRLAGALDQGISQPVPLIVIDLSAVSFLDVRTIACLRRASQLLAADNRRLALVGAQPAVERSLRLVEGLLPAPRRDGSAGTRSVATQVTLTRRQHEILGLLEQGLSTGQIARRLWLSPATVRNHVAAIFAALDVHSRLQAVRRARQLGLL
jgi:anti-anti-sigma factor